MNEAQKTVLKLTSAALFNKAIDVKAEPDWPAVYSQIKAHSLVSLLYPIVDNMCIPSTDIRDQWSAERDKYLINNAVNIGGHFAIQRLLDDAGIQCVILKGLASASYYPSYLLRAFGDVDFIVPKADYRRASSLLKKHGYKYINRHDKHMIYSRNGLYYELHRDIVGLPDTSIKIGFQKHFSDLFESALPFDHQGARCMIPSNRHHAVILLLHTAEHLSKTGVGLRHICDWAAFVNRMPDSFFERELQPLLKDMGLWHFASILTCLCTEYIGLRSCPWVDYIPEDLLADLIDDVFESGEFGRIHEGSAHKDPAKQMRNSALTKTRTFNAFIYSLNKGARTVIPASSKHPILLPAGWAFVIGRYAARIITGKRSAKSAKENIVRLGERRCLTDELHLFERQNENDQIPV